MYLSVLNSKQIKLLKKLKFLKKYGFYLAGGTALALHFRHRTSLDFDFYTEKKFDNKKLLRELEERFRKKIKLVQNPEQTLIVKINNRETSFFYYPYPLIYPLIRIKEFPLIASKEDIAAMKVISIIQRGIKRDFIDIYFLIKELGLKKIFEVAEKKYHSFNPYLALQSLTYFVDAEREKIKRRITYLKPVNWTKIKKNLINTVNEFKKLYLK
ncbi:MAG: nucleotidyl transferase AbiEii/AbiGii toxin family protein [Patescibacteria group bacterium]|nr:nucleotidyl transferase AbiEii/AbiGii toxin family protein [Patescibacteria group bacterium]